MGVVAVESVEQLSVELNKLELSEDDLLVVRVQEYMEPEEMSIVQTHVQRALYRLGLGDVVALIAPEEITVDTLRSLQDEWLKQFKSEWERRYAG